MALDPQDAGRTQASASGSDSREVGAAEPPLVLVVDDNLQNRLVAEGHLLAFGYRVAMADGGEAALQMFEEQPPDLILLDVLMPGMDGLEVCRRIRAMPGGLDVPICFLTALSDLGTFKEASEAGGDDYLSKPIRQSELLLRVRSLIRIRRLQRALEQRNEELLFEQEQRRRLAAMLVHDLKSPLAAQLLNCDYLAGMPMEADALEAIDDVRQAARWMQRMLLELLDLHRAEDAALRPRREPVRIEDAVRDAFSRVQPLSAEAGQQLEVAVEPEDLILDVDPDLFQRVLANLLDNCAKYAPRGRAVRVDVRRHPEETLITVIDGGPGIPAAQRDAIFSLYGQLEAGAHRTSRGLGLAFCRVAVQAHGGTIDVVDAPTGGTAFRIALPHT